MDLRTSLLVLLCACGARPTPPPSSGPPEAWTAWQEARTRSLAGEDGWLTLVALCWLDDGRLTLGSAPDAGCVIAEHAPPQLGTLERRDDGMHFVAAAGVEVLSDGAPVTDVVLTSDASETYTVLSHGPLRFHLIDRGGRLGIRVKDRESAARSSFAGVPVYDYDPALVIPAQFAAAAPASVVPIVNVLGMQIDEPIAGTLTFTVAGSERTMTVMPGGDAPEDGLFLMLRDGTSGETTYGAGRYLDVPAPDAEGATTLDFNFLETPPCGFTELATCPLPPPENEIEAPIAAGERWLGEHVEHETAPVVASEPPSVPVESEPTEEGLTDRGLYDIVISIVTDPNAVRARRVPRRAGDLSWLTDAAFAANDDNLDGNATSMVCRASELECVVYQPGGVTTLVLQERRGQIVIARVETEEP